MVILPFRLLHRACIKLNFSPVKVGLEEPGFVADFSHTANYPQAELNQLPISISIITSAPRPVWLCA